MNPIQGNYVDGFLLSVPNDKLDAYRNVATGAAAIWREHGALQYIEAAGDDLNTEGMRSFTETAGAKEGETVIFAWALFASREARDEANAKIMEDPRIKEICPVSQDLFDCKRMAYGGFRVIVQG